MTSSSKQIYTYMSVKDVISQRVKKSYGYEVEILLRDIEEYEMEGERSTIIMSLETDTNRRETNHISMDML